MGILKIISFRILMTFFRILYIPYFVIFSIIFFIIFLINPILMYTIWCITNYEIDLDTIIIPKLIEFDSKIKEFLCK